MKVAVVTGEREATIVDQPDPCIKAPFVKVKIYAAPMCTEVHAYANGKRLRLPWARGSWRGRRRRSWQQGCCGRPGGCDAAVWLWCLRAMRIR